VALLTFDKMVVTWPVSFWSPSWHWTEAFASYDEVFQKTTQTEPSIEGADMTKDGDDEAGAGTHTNVDDRRYNARVQDTDDRTQKVTYRSVCLSQV